MRRGPTRATPTALAPPGAGAAQAIGLLLALAVVGWAGAAFAQGDKALNTLSRVEVRETERSTEIVISGDTPPTFTVFKLSDPTRLFVDISNADIGGLETPVEVDNGVVSQITALQFNDEVVRIGRLIIGLEVDALYSVEARGNALWVVVDASQRKTKRPIVINQGDPAAVAAAERRAAEAETRARAAEARAEAAQDARAQALAQAEAARERATAAEATAEARAQEARQSAGADASAAEERARAAAAARDAALAEARAAERRAAEAESAIATTRADADARVAAAEARAQAALAQAEQATAAAEARAREAEQLAQRRASEAQDAEGRARGAAEALAQARAATAAAEGRAQQATADARSQVEAAEARLKEAQIAAAAARQSQLAAEARAREADAARGSAQQALAAVQARAQEAQAAAENAREAQAAAEARASELAAATGAARESAAAAEAQARAQAQAAEARALAAATAEREARAQAQAAEGRAASAAAAADAQRGAAAAAEQQALAASQRANAAEERAMAAEARAGKAEERASAAEQRLASIARERQDAEARLRDLESAQAALAAQLDAAKAANDGARMRQLEAEERARLAELGAQQARLAQLDSARQKGESEKRIAELENLLAAAEREGDTAQVERLVPSLEAARAESGRLDDDLQAQDQALASARGSAQQERAEADRLGVAAATPAPAAGTRHRITDVRFDDEPGQTRIIIAVEGRPRHRVNLEGERTRVLELEDALIEPVLERSLDTAEFPSAVQLVSSFQAPPPGDRVRIAVTLSQAVEDQVSFEEGRLIWTFAKPGAGRAVAGLPIPGVAPAGQQGAPAGGRSAPPPVGYTAPPPPVGFATDRAAAYVGTAQLGAGAGEAPTDRRRRRLVKKYTGRKINIDIKDGDIHNILRLLAKEGNVNIVTSDEVQGSVTLHLKLVPWDQALDIILRSKGLDMVRDGDIIRVAPADIIAKEQQAELDKLKVAEQLEPLKVKLLTVNHAQATDLAARVKTLLSARGKVDFDQRTNTLIVNDVADHIEAAADLVRRLDTQTSQILLQARIVEVNTNELQELGIQWGGNATSGPAFGNATGLYFPGVIGLAGGSDDIQTPARGLPTVPNFVVNLPAAVGGGAGGSLGLQFGSIDGAFNLNVRLSALENRGTVRVISEPRIATLDNVRAMIKDGVRIPISQVSAAGIQTQFFDANLELQATPQVTQDGNIYLDLRVTKSTPDFQNTAARGDPTILNKEAQTKLLMADGETMVIGGIYSSQNGYGYSEVPLLGRIPILGAFFRKYTEDNRRSELLIFVTPQIMNRKESAVRTGQ